jgi:class 3 adenylate cyclase
MRIAVHTGEVEFMPDGELSTGRAVNRVFRLVGAAKAGQVLVSETTATLAVKGFSKPVRISELVLAG